MASKSNTNAASSGNRKKSATGTVRRARSCVLYLKGQLGIHDVTDLKAKLSGFLEAKSAITLDASKVEKIDTCTLQLLTVFYRSASIKSIEIKWKNPSNRLLHAAKLLGLSDSLGLKTVTPKKAD